MGVDTLNTHADCRQSGCRNVVKDQISRWGVLPRKRDYQLGTEEHVDGGIGDLELNGDQGGGSIGSKTHSLFDGNGGRGPDRGGWGNTDGIAD